MRYLIHIRPDSELYWSSYLFCGLYELAAERLIDIRYRFRLPFSPKEIYATAFVVEDLEGGEVRSVVIDWRDNPDMVCLDKLSWCDVYYKRNLIPERTFPICPASQIHKIRPAGLSFSVRTERERPLWVQVIGGLCSVEQPIFHKSLMKTVRRLKGIYKGPRRVQTFLREVQFTSGDCVTVENVILFQTKAYDPQGSAYPDDNYSVTHERAEYIRALRQEFGPRFRGGFVPSPYARTKYPDCLVDGKIEQSNYIELVKNSRICIYTRGLRDSPAFKMGEYLAAGRCILSDEIKTQLPRPLMHGEQLLFFHNADDLIKQCCELLQDKSMQQRLSAGALAYYEQEVKPRNRVLRFLQEAF